MIQIDVTITWTKFSNNLNNWWWLPLWCLCVHPRTLISLASEFSVSPQFWILSSAIEACRFIFSQYNNVHWRVLVPGLISCIYLCVPIGSINHEEEHTRLNYCSTEHPVPNSLLIIHAVRVINVLLSEYLMWVMIRFGGSIVAGPTYPNTQVKHVTHDQTQRDPKHVVTYNVHVGHRCLPPCPDGHTWKHWLDIVDEDAEGEYWGELLYQRFNRTVAGEQWRVLVTNGYQEDSDEESYHEGSNHRNP